MPILTVLLVSFFGFQENAFSGRPASGGALAPEPPRVTRIQPEPYGCAPKSVVSPLAKFYFEHSSGSALAQPSLRENRATRLTPNRMDVE